MKVIIFNYFLIEMCSLHDFGFSVFNVVVWLLRKIFEEVKNDGCALTFECLSEKYLKKK
jgi:hypothetical protein